MASSSLSFRSRVGRLHSKAEIERLSPLQKKAVFLVSLGEFIDGYDLIVIGAAILFLKPQFHLSPSQVGQVGAAAYIGAAVGLLIFGKMSDRYGRRTIFLFNLMFFVVASLLSAFITNVPELYIARFFVGVGVGADIPASMSYIAEISPKSQRARLLGGVPQITWVVGAGVSTVLAVLLIKLTGGTAWRWLFGISAIPAFMVLLGRRSLPESPRYLRLQGRVAEAEQVLERFGIEERINTVSAAAQFREIFSPIFRLRTAIVTTVNIFDCLAVGISTISVPFILRYVGLLSVDASLLFSGAVWLADLVGCVLNFWLADRFPRRAIAFSTMAAMGLSGIGIALFGLHHPSLLIVLVMLFGFFHWLGSAQCVWAWGSELFPTRIRGSAQGFANGGCRIALAANIFWVPVGIATVGFRTTIFLLALPALFNAVLVLVFRQLETEGVSLDVLGGEGSSSA